MLIFVSLEALSKLVWSCFAGEANLIDAPRILNALNQTQQERQRALQNHNLVSENAGIIAHPSDEVEDIEMSEAQATQPSTLPQGARGPIPRVLANAERPGSACSLNSLSDRGEH